MDAGVLAAAISGGCGILGAVATAILGRVASARARHAEELAGARARRAEQQREDLDRLRVLLDEQREELDWRATEHAATRAELAALRRRLEEGQRGG
ncbi:hypothetical protein [Candidatus Frankia alpina]|uniref:hypothetical protein n=1 Tax=Candidatus Frankia alpina TaxID=2699483 RepID=UPI0013D11521|nr:hypothetical protein [Candidatus Frankia alpina]